MTGLVYANLSLNWLTRRLQTIRKKSNERTSECLLHKETCIKEQIFSNYFMLVAFSSPVKSSRSVFSGMSFRVKFEVVRLQKQFLSVVANHSKSDFSTVNRVADSEEIRQV